MKAEEVKKMQTEVIEGFEDFATMIGKVDETKKAKYGFVPGIGMVAEADDLRIKAENVRNGVFNVMFTGVFNAGKSTLINALIRKNLLQTASRSETPTINKISFGKNRDCATVVFNDGRPNEVLDIDTFKKKYRLKDKEVNAIINLIDHVDIEQIDSHFDNLTQIVDTLGLDSAAKENELTLKYEPQADAIVFLINANTPMTMQERDRVNQKYAYKGLKNVFFVVTHKDQLNDPEDLQDVKDAVSEALKPVFQNPSGTLNQALMNKRVFYVDSFGALYFRTGAGKPSTTPSEEETGVPAFEAALTEFLLSDEKYKNSYKADLQKLRTAFVKFDKCVSERVDAFNTDLTVLEQKQQAQDAAITAVMKELDGIKMDSTSFFQTVSVLTERAYMNFVNSVRSDWDNYFSAVAPQVQFGPVAMGQLGWYNIRNKFSGGEYEWDIQQLLKPITDEIISTHTEVVVENNNVVEKTIIDGGYIKTKLDEFKAHLQLALENEMKRPGGFRETLNNRIEKMNAQVEQADVDFEEILKNALESMGVKTPDDLTAKGSLVQAIVALVLTGNIDNATDALVNDLRIGEFVVKLVVTQLVEAIIIYVINAITGVGFLYVIIRAIFAVFQINRAGSTVVAEAFAKAKEQICTELEANAPGVSANIYHGVATTMGDSVNKIIKGVDMSMASERDRLAEIIQAVGAKKTNIEDEKVRVAKVKARMMIDYNKISKVAEGREYSLNEIYA